jgi:hypothetical protein
MFRTQSVRREGSIEAIAALRSALECRRIIFIDENGGGLGFGGGAGRFEEYSRTE